MSNFLFLLNLASLLLIIGLIDLSNIDNFIYVFLNRLLGIKQFSYFDVPLLKILEIFGVFIATYIPFHILRKEQKFTRKKMELEQKPVFEPSQIRFKAFSTNIKIELQNIGSGPALFVRLSFIENYSDKPKQSILRFNEPHSRDLAVMNNPPSKFFMDSRAFATFITGSSEGGDIAADPMNFNNRNKKNKLNVLYRSKVGTTYFMYIHCLDVLNNKLIYKIKFLLELEDDFHSNDPEFLLKRMEVKEILKKVN